MYIPVGDRVLVTLHQITEEVKIRKGIILPPGFKHEEEPPDLLEIIEKGEGPACDLLTVGDMVLLQPRTSSFEVFTSKEDKVIYFIVNAANVIGRARRINEEHIKAHSEPVIPN